MKTDRETKPTLQALLNLTDIKVQCGVVWGGSKHGGGEKMETHPWLPSLSPCSSSSFTSPSPVHRLKEVVLERDNSKTQIET